METAVLSPLAASAEKTNGDKLSRFSIDGETTVLRKAFDDFYPTTNFASVLNGNYSILNNHLRKRIVNKDQWDKLFSPDGVESDFHKFNITLLFLLLINICSSSDPLSGWHDKAPPHDVCFEANRNVLFCNMTSTSVDGQTFPLLWQEVSSTLHALGLDQAEIDRLRTEHGGEQDYIDALIEWDDSENKIKTQLKDIHQTQLELRKALQDGNSKLEELLSNARRKTQDVADEAVKMEPKGQQEMTAAHKKSMSCLEGLSHQEMTTAHQKSMSCLEGLSHQEMTTAHQKSMSCLEELSHQEMTAAHQKRMLCLGGISHKEMTAAHQKSMSCLEGLSHQEMTAAHQKRMLCLEGISHKEMTAARQKSMSCLEGLSHQEMTAAHQKRMLCLEGISHKEMTAARQKSMSCLEGLSDQEMTAAHQKSMSCLEGLSHQEMTAAHQKRMLCLEGISHKEMTAARQKSMSCLEGLSDQEMTAAHQKSMSCLEGLSHQEMTAGHQKNMSLLEGLVIKSQSKTQQEIHEIRESVQQIKHEVKTLKKRTNEQTDEVSN